MFRNTYWPGSGFLPPEEQLLKNHKSILQQEKDALNALTKELREIEAEIRTIKINNVKVEAQIKAKIPEVEATEAELMANLSHLRRES